MLETKASPLISSPLREAVSTSVVTDEPITRHYGRQSRARERWEALIDYQLIEWGRNPSQLEDEDIQAPSKMTIHLATLLAGALSKFDFPAPTRIVPDAHGGIVFERRDGNAFESIRLSADGSVEYCFFENSRLVSHEHWGVIED